VIEKAAIARLFLREAATARRQSKGQRFYSIRTIAKHFSIPPSRVTRLYGPLKTEGILSSMWGSKTIIEPAHLDNHIRLRAMVALPIPLRTFSVLSTYTDFVRSMQDALWKERFASQIIFYDEAIFDGSIVTEAG